MNMLRYDVRGKPAFIIFIRDIAIVLFPRDLSSFPRQSFTQRSVLICCPLLYTLRKEIR